jgi:uncharacterized protein (DUF924 family)
MDRANEILKYWFGHVEETILPTPNRTHIWFSESANVDQEIREKFLGDLEKAILGEYDSWVNSPRLTLALIILLDQFSRRVYRNTPLAFSQDAKALDLCIRGIEKEFDHTISLMERVFFYFPLIHAENLETQTTSVRAYKILADLSFPEVKAVFESFLDFSLKHFDIIKRFGRFPQRNEILGRPSTAEEIKYLQEELKGSANHE